MKESDSLRIVFRLCSDAEQSLLIMGHVFLARKKGKVIRQYLCCLITFLEISLLGCRTLRTGRAP